MTTFGELKIGDLFRRKYGEHPLYMKIAETPSAGYSNLAVVLLDGDVGDLKRFEDSQEVYKEDDYLVLADRWPDSWLDDE